VFEDAEVDLVALLSSFVHGGVGGWGKDRRVVCAVVGLADRREFKEKNRSSEEGQDALLRLNYVRWN
jgi:hypothetical protein